jgi:hypothetical protein
MITISDRAKLIFTRWIDLWGDNIIARAKEQDDDIDDPEVEVDSVCFGDSDIGMLSLTISVMLGYCEEGCDNWKDAIAFPKKCETCKSTTQEIIISLSYHKKNEKKTNLYSTRIYLECITPDMFRNIIKALPPAYHLCSCEQKVCDSTDPESPKSKWCATCFVYRYTRTEEQGGDCCICYENEGRWTRFSCGHEIHHHCYMKLSIDPEKIRISEYATSACKRCPLCRDPIKKGITDCYDV